MKKQLLTSILFPTCAIAHHLLFWNEKMGLNTLLFAILMIAALFYLHRESTQSRPALLSAVGVLLTACMVVLHNSLMAKTVHALFFIALIGFVQGPELRFVFYAFCLGVVSFFEMRVKVLRELLPARWKTNPTWQLASNMQMMAVVTPVVLVFFGMYFFANGKFAEMSGRAFTGFFDWLWENFTLSGMISMALSILIAGSILWKASSSFFQKMQQRQVFQLVRSAPQKPLYPFTRSMISLKKEHRTALLLVVLLNKLLLVVNLVDIRYVWFGAVPENPYDLKNDLHDGTFILIAAILLAMAVLLVVFRKNLNFFPNNRWIRWLSYAWIVQNAVLAFSVGVRNWRYIEASGLAYKRIGVIGFLLLTLFGLVTMWLKISQKRSLYFLWYHNGWALFGLLALAACVNWDVFITRYNLAASTRENNLDLVFLLHGVSDKNLYVLSSATIRPESKERFGRLPGDFEKALNHKWGRFLAEQKDYSWLSWNWADARNLAYYRRGGDRN